MGVKTSALGGGRRRPRAAGLSWSLGMLLTQLTCATLSLPAPKGADSPLGRNWPLVLGRSEDFLRRSRNKTGGNGCVSKASNIMLTFPSYWLPGALPRGRAQRHTASLWGAGVNSDQPFSPSPRTQSCVWPTRKTELPRESTRTLRTWIFKASPQKTV